MNIWDVITYAIIGLILTIHGLWFYFAIKQGGVSPARYVCASVAVAGTLLILYLFASGKYHF